MLVLLRDQWRTNRKRASPGRRPVQGLAQRPSFGCCQLNVQVREVQSRPQVRKPQRGGHLVARDSEDGGYLLPFRSVRPSSLLLYHHHAGGDR